MGKRGKGRRKFFLVQGTGRSWGRRKRVWEFLRVTELGIPLEVTFLAEGRRGGGAPLVAGVSRLPQPRLREHEAGQARADVIGSAPRAPGRAGEGGHRAGRERGREGVAQRRWPNKLEGWDGVPGAIHPKTFSPTHCKGRRDPSGSDSKAPSVARALPPPRSLPSPGPRSEHPQACPLGSGLPPPLPGLPVLRGPATRSKLLPPATAQAQPPRLLLWLPPSAARPRSYVR